LSYCLGSTIALLSGIYYCAIVCDLLLRYWWDLLLPYCLGSTIALLSGIYHCAIGGIYYCAIGGIYYCAIV